MRLYRPGIIIDSRSTVALFQRLLLVMACPNSLWPVRPRRALTPTGNLQSARSTHKVGSVRRSHLAGRALARTCGGARAALWPLSFLVGIHRQAAAPAGSAQLVGRHHRAAAAAHRVLLEHRWAVLSLKAPAALAGGGDRAAQLCRSSFGGSLATRLAAVRERTCVNLRRTWGLGRWGVG